MTGLRLLADDLTGALDSAARFVPVMGPIAVGWHTEPAAEHAAFDSGTRDLAASAIHAAYDRSAGFLRPGNPAFKKIDSLLRGHVAAELAATMRDFDHCVLAPAFPFQGRITRGGRQLRWDGAGWRDTGVDLPAALRALGTTVTLQDAATDADLDAIVAAGRRLPGRVLWCGTGGLAGALAEHRLVPRPTLPRPILALVGTEHPVSVGQLAAVARLHHRLPLQATQEIRASLTQGAAAVSVALPSGTSRDQARHQIATRFATLLAEIDRPGTLFLAGGETLRAVSDALGVGWLEADGELEPGVPTSLMRGGAWDGQRVVSKSGAFGDSGFLARLIGSPGPIPEPFAG